jgi:hypothetical protein
MGTRSLDARPRLTEDDFVLQFVVVLVFQEIKIMG